MSQLYAPAQLVSTPEEKETAFSNEGVARQGTEPAEIIDNVEHVCVEKGNEEVKRALEEHQQAYTANQEM